VSVAGREVKKHIGVPGLVVSETNDVTGRRQKTDVGLDHMDEYHGLYMKKPNTSSTGQGEDFLEWELR